MAHLLYLVRSSQTLTLSLTAQILSLSLFQIFAPLPLLNISIICCIQVLSLWPHKFINESRKLPEGKD